jgi:hypothetical protein
VPAAVGLPLKVIVLPTHDALTPAGKPLTPLTPSLLMPVAPVVACVLLIALLIHKVVLEIVAAVLMFTVIVPVALVLPQPPVNGML